MTRRSPGPISGAGPLVLVSTTDIEAPQFCFMGDAELTAKGSAQEECRRVVPWVDRVYEKPVVRSGTN